MPFVTDIAGPQRPVQTWPPLAVGACDAPAPSTPIRPGPGTPTSTCGPETRVGRGRRGVDVLGQVGVRAHLADRVIDDIVADPPDDRRGAAAGSRVGPGFRSTVGTLLPDEVGRAGLLHLLLDDWVGAALVSGYAVQHAAITLGIEEKLRRRHRRPHGRHLRGLRAGRLARPVRQAQRHHPVGARTGRAAAGRRRRAHRRTASRRTACGGSAGWTSADETVVLRRALPRLARRRRRRRDDRARVHRRGLGRRIDENHHLGRRATVRVLPWQECPGAIGSAARIRGMTLSQNCATGSAASSSAPRTCTHLNDTLRAVADLDALLDLRAGL